MAEYTGNWLPNGDPSPSRALGASGNRPYTPPPAWYNDFLKKQYPGGFDWGENGPTNMESDMTDPTKVFNYYLLHSGMSPNQTSFYKNNMSMVAKPFMTGQGPVGSKGEASFASYLNGFDWTGNDQYKLFGPQADSQYGFVPYAIKWR
jgi:hypothetical protein